VSGDPIDLGLVGTPVRTEPTLLLDLLQKGYLPVVASIGVTSTGELLNVNADTLAAHLAGELKAERLIVAGGTAGVLDASGASIPRLTLERVDTMIGAGEAHSGMIAKLTACSTALIRGVAHVSIVSGRDVTNFDTAAGTRITAEGVTA
jgi:acetylglutamate kinase